MAAGESASAEEFFEQGWPKDHQADRDRTQYSDEYGASRRILGLGDQGMNLGDRRIRQALYCGVQGFHGPDQGDGRDEPEPAVSSEFHVPSGCEYCDAGDRVDPRVVLTLDRENDAMNREAEAPDAFKYGEPMTHGESPPCTGKSGLVPRISQGEGQRVARCPLRSCGAGRRAADEVGSWGPGSIPGVAGGFPSGGMRAEPMSRFVIQGGQPLSGQIAASGSKNAVLPMIAAALLTDEEVVLENVPDLRDVSGMLEILEYLGASVSRSPGKLVLRARDVAQSEIPFELCERTRTSFLFVAPLLHRLGRACVHPPGGDQIGRRRLDAHFYGLRGLGVELDEDKLEFRRDGRLAAAMLFFDEPSVTATEHILMAAVVAEGQTTLLNAASEPHVQDLCRLLQGMGADIEGLGSNTLTITGVDRLHGTTHCVVSDHIEVGSYLALAAATGGGVTVTGTVRGHYWMLNRIFERFGLDLDIQSDRIVMAEGQVPQVRQDAGGVTPRVDDGPWPQFPTDMMSPMVVLATQSHGTALFFEKMFESRLYFVDPLIQMGANILVCDPHRVQVTGPTPLRGQTVRSPDIRAGMALLIAALCARGRPSVVQNAEILDRGYEKLDEKLAALGADITRE